MSATYDTYITRWRISRRNLRPHHQTTAFPAKPRCKPQLSLLPAEDWLLRAGKLALPHGFMWGSQLLF